MSLPSHEIVVGSAKEFKFICEIKNFSAIEVDAGVPVISPEFFTAYSTKRTLRWRLKLYPNGRDNDNKDYISLYLQNMNEFEVTVKYSISIMNDSQNDFSRPDPIIKTLKPLESCGWPQFVKKTSVMNTRNRTLVNDALIVSCSVFSTSSLMDSCDIDEDVSEYNKLLFESGNYSDIRFSIEGKEMHLHKAIVASVSPVFEAMFMNDMKESKDNLVVVKDVKYEVMKDLFRYIYTRNVNDTNINDLLIAADKYAIGGLKTICEIRLAATLNDDNALQLLQLAVVYNASYLKPKVVELVANKLKTFVGKNEFKLLSHDCKDEIFIALANKLSVE